MKKFLKVLVLFVVMFVFYGCENKNYEIIKENGEEVYSIEGSEYIISDESSNFVMIDVKNKGIIIAELYPDIAPITVENFKKLVSEKFYDGLVFHRVIMDFMIQTGDPLADSTGGSDETIKGEFSLNGVENSISHTRGVLSMARRGSNPETEETMNSASSQFFIVHKDSDFLDGNYAAFGKVINGMDVVDKIAASSIDEYDKPINDQVINSIKFVLKKVVK